MSVDKSKLGLPEQGNIEILNLKAAPSIVADLLKKQDYFPAYHMNKKHWYTLCLDNSITDADMITLLSMSYQCTGKK